MAFIAPIIGAISSAVAGVAGFLGSLGFVGRAVISVGFNVIAGLLTKKKSKKSSKASDSQLSGTSLTVTYGGSKPREIGVGLFAVAGQELFTCAFGDGNKTLARVLLLSDFYINKVTRVLIDDEWCSLNGDNNSERGFEVTGKHKGYIRIKIYDGSQTTADNYLIKGSGGQWTANHVGFGLAYAIVYFDYDQNEMSNTPQLLFECQGKCYDPRLDSSYGGEGSQRWEDPKTWGYSDNPIVQAYNYERGFYVNGQLIVGKDLSVADLPVQKWVEAMNLCDEMVGTEKRYRSGMIFSAGEGVQHKDNLEPLFTACAGALLESVDGDLPIVGVTQPIVATLTEDDLIIGETLNYTPKRSSSQLVNAVHGTYNEPEKSWEAVAYPARLDAGALAADGSHHGTQLDFKAVFIASQAIRLANSALRENRYQKQYSMVVRPLWRKLEVGDWVRFIHSRYGTAIFRVVSRSLTPCGKQGARNVNLSLQEVGAGIYDDSIEIPEFSPNKPAQRPVFQNFPDQFQVMANQAISEDQHRKIPVFDITWRQPTDVTVTGVEIEYWQTKVPERKLNYIVRGTQTAVRLTGFAPRTSYTFHATVITEPARSTLWCAEVVADSKDEDYDTDQILQDVAELNKWLTYDRRSIREENELIGLIAADATSGGYELSRSIKRELTVSLGKARADFTEQITVAISKTSALAAKLETLEAEVNGNIATAFNEIKAQVDTINGKVTANAQQLSFLNAQVDKVSSSITIKSEVSSTASDGWARYGVSVKVGDTTNWSTGAWYVDVQTATRESRFVVLVDRFLIADPNQSFQPFSFANGQLRSNAADIGTVTAGELNINNRFKVARDGTVEISGYAGSGRSVLTNSRYEVYDNAGRLRVQLGVW